MATTSTISEHSLAPAATAPLLVSAASLPRESFDHLLQTLAAAFPGESIVVASPDAASHHEPSAGPVRVVGYAPTAVSTGSWTLVAADFLNAQELVQKHQAKAVLLLGAEAQTLEAGALRSLALTVLEGKVDLAVPRYTLPARAGLVNSAILYPISRALFGGMPRFPLALDLGMSARMTERLATTAQRFTAINQPEALLWPVAEAAGGSFPVLEVEAGRRVLPQPEGLDLNTVLAQVTGSLFAEVDARAPFWQRARIAHPIRHTASTLPTEPAPAEEIQSMLDSFRLAYSNLQEIWSLVLPPQSLFGLKRLSIMPAETFAMPDSLWARIVYDFLLAYRLRTINRGHLLGALTPLYLAWVASHISTGTKMDPERHVEAAAQAFETEKPYLVSRWRWPDRFNP